MKKYLMVLAVLLSACSSQTPQTSPTPTPSVNDCSEIVLADKASVGENALPDANIECLQGTQSINISHLRGPMVMPVWASWCEPCSIEMPIFQKFYDAHHDKVAVLGVALQDTTEQAIGGAFNWGVSLPSLEDPDGAYRGFLEVQAPPTTLFIDTNGEVVYRKVGAVQSLQELESLVTKYLKVKF
jgi:cytochrome c biogenesis protein CcmG/thiol:disulfide interchange protein DsbE